MQIIFQKKGFSLTSCPPEEHELNDIRKYLKESCVLSPGEHFSLKHFLNLSCQWLIWPILNDAKNLIND